MQHSLITIELVLDISMRDFSIHTYTQLLVVDCDFVYASLNLDGSVYTIMR